MEEKFMRRRSDDLILVAAFAAFPWCLALCALLSAHRQAARLLSALMGPPPPKKPAQRLVVLIPAFNVASTIGRALQGVLADSCTALLRVVMALERMAPPVLMAKRSQYQSWWSKPPLGLVGGPTA